MGPARRIKQPLEGKIPLLCPGPADEAAPPKARDATYCARHVR